MKKFCIVFLVVISSLSLKSVSADSEKKYFHNSNGVLITLSNYDKLLDFGFSDDEINNMTSEQYDTLYNLDVVGSKDFKKYIAVMEEKSKYEDETGEFSTITLESEEEFINIVSAIKDKKVKDNKIKNENNPNAEDIDIVDDSSMVMLLGGLPLDELDDGGGGSSDGSGSPSFEDIDPRDDCIMYTNESTCFTDVDEWNGAGVLNLNVTYVGDSKFFVKTSMTWYEMTSPLDITHQYIAFTIPPDMKVDLNSIGGMAIQEYYNPGFLDEPYDEVLTVNTRSYNSNDNNVFDLTNLYNGLILRDDISNTSNFLYQLRYLSVTEWAIVKGVASNFDVYAEDAPSEYTFTAIETHLDTTLTFTDLGFGVTWPPSINFNLGAGEYEGTSNITVNFDKDTFLEWYALSNEILEDDIGNDFNMLWTYDENAPITSFYNKNEVFISRQNYELLAQLGFSYREIMYFTEDELSIYDDYKISSYVGQVVNSSSDYKILTMTVNKLDNGNYFIKLNQFWTRLPSNRYWDLLAINAPAYSDVINFRGKQIVGYTGTDDKDYTVYNYNSINQSSYFSINDYGIIMKHNLVNDADMIFATLEAEIDVGTWENYDIYGILMHQVDYYAINNTQFQSPYMVYYIDFNPSTLENYYDTVYSVHIDIE